MTCNCEKFIYIFKGDDTNWNNERFLNVTVTSDIDLTGMTAKFILGAFSQTFPLTTGRFSVNLSRAVTGAFANGPINGVIQILDEEQRIKTITNTIPFYVTSHVIDEQDVDYNCNVSPNSPIEINVNLGGGGGRAEWGYIGGNIEDQEDLQEALAAKVSKSGDTMTGPLSFGDFSISSDDGLAKIEGTQYGLRVDTTSGLGAALLTANGLGDVLTSLNVQSTYSSTGMDPVNGTAVASAISTKQDTLTQEQQAAVNSGIDSTKVGQIATNASDISTINGKIPAQATTENQLADKNFVNSSIATNTANFIGTFNSVAELEAYSGTLTNNDYAFVVGTDSEGNTVYDRYKYNANTEEWVFEYELNNSSFTAAQWAAINSGITDTAVTQIGTNTSNITSLQTNKLDASTAASTYLPLNGGTLTNTGNQLKIANTSYASNLGTFVFDVPGQYFRIYNQTTGTTKPALFVDYASNTVLVKGSKLKDYSSNTEAVILDANDKGIANGIASLDGNKKIPIAQLPMDSALNTSSTNPVENGVVATALNSKLTYAMVIREW